MTPTIPPTMAAAVLYLIDANDRNEVHQACLSGEERTRAERFVFPHDASRWSHYRAGLRRILGTTLGIDPQEVPLIEGPGGKPALASPHDRVDFNMSHSNDLAAVVISHDGSVGIDLEPWSRAPSLIESADFFCHPDELNRLPLDPEDRARQLLMIWTAKEALLKAIGTGLSYPPQQLRIDGDQGLAVPPLDRLSDFRLLIPDHPEFSDHRMAVAVNHGIDKIEWAGTLGHS